MGFARKNEYSEGFIVSSRYCLLTQKYVRGQSNTLNTVFSIEPKSVW